MQLPIGPGLWPAFWALGSDIGSVGWPASGEIDYMENVPASSGQGPGIISSTIHGPGYSGANGLGKQYVFPNGEQVNTAFHVYGAIWSPYMIQFYVDDPSNVFFVRTASDIPAGTTWPFNNNFFLLLNLAVGGTGSWPGPPGSTTPSPAQMLVDYVRVYQPAAISGPTMTATPVTLTAGSVGASTINLSSIGGTGLVYLTCSGAPAKAACAVNTGNALNAYVVDFSSSATATGSVNVTTTANTAALPAPTNLKSFGSSLNAASLSGWIGILGMVALCALFAFPRRIRFVGSRGVRFRAAGILSLAILFVPSCGGGSNSATQAPPSNGTPPGQYTLTVTAYTVSGGTSSVSIPLNVN